jgi:phosphoribosylamine-glycine ligase
MPTRLTYQFPSHDDPVVPLKITEESDSWWAGSMLSMGRLALGVAVAANTASAAIGTQIAQQSEQHEIVKPLKVEDEYWQNPSQLTLTGAYRLNYNPQPQVWAAEQHEIVKPLKVEDEYWRNGVPPVPQTFLVPWPWSGEQQEIVSLQGDEEAWGLPRPWASVVRPSIPGDDDFAAPLTVPGIPDEDYQSYTLRIQQLPTGFGAGTFVPPPPIQDEDSWSIPAPQNEGYLWMVAPWAWGSSGDEVGLVPGDEDWYQPPRPWVIPSAHAVTADDEITQPPAAVLPPDEDFWQPPAPWPVTTARAFQAEDEPPHPLAYEDDSSAVYPAPVIPLPPIQAVQADDEVRQPATPIQDEDAWTSGVAPQLWWTFLLSPSPLEQDEQAFGLVPPPPPPPTTVLGGGSAPIRPLRIVRVDEPEPEPEPAPPPPARPKAPKPVEAQPFRGIPVAVPPLPPVVAPSVTLEIADRTAQRHATVQAEASVKRAQEVYRRSQVTTGPVVVVTRHWGGLGMALLMQRQGADVIAAYDYTHVPAKELEATETCGDGLIEKLPLEKAMRQMVGKRALWVFDGNDVPVQAEKLRAQNEAVIGTSKLSQKLEDDRDYAAAMAESVGFGLPLTEKFTDYGKALQFLTQHQDQAFVYKPDKQDPTATYVPLTSDPKEANHELQAYLESLSGTSQPSFILQEQVQGVEANFELWVRDGRPVAGFCDLESKRKLVGDLGENVGCAGGYVFALPLDSPGLARTVGLYLHGQRLGSYTGSVDVNVMIVDGKPLFLENCFRFGYNAYPTIFQALAQAPAEEILRQWVRGTETLERFFRPGIGGSLSLVIDHPKMGIPVLVPKAIQDSVYLYREYQAAYGLAMVEGWSEIACVTALGKDIPDAGRQCLDLAQQVAFPGKGYRIDLAGSDLPTLPLARYRALQQMGFLPRDPDDDDDEALTALLELL